MGWMDGIGMVIIEVVGLFRASSVPIMLIMMMMGAREDRQGKGATVGHCGREGTRHKVLEASVLSTGFPLMCNCDGEKEEDVDYTYSDDTFQENIES